MQCTYDSVTRNGIPLVLVSVSFLLLSFFFPLHVSSSSLPHNRYRLLIVIPLVALRFHPRPVQHLLPLVRSLFRHLSKCCVCARPSLSGGVMYKRRARQQKQLQDTENQENQPEDPQDQKQPVSSTSSLTSRLVSLSHSHLFPFFLSHTHIQFRLLTAEIAPFSISLPVLSHRRGERIVESRSLPVLANQQQGHSGRASGE